MTMTENTPAAATGGFAQFNLPPAIHMALARMNYTIPTPVQAQAIPLALTGRDILGSAQTGTGKTGAFTIPVVARLLEDPEAMAVILSPTRELASQILTVARDLLHKGSDGKGALLKTALLIGGDSMGKQFDQLRAQPRLIIGTPGRINDHLRRNPRLLEKAKIVVLDEADRMLDMGFSGQIDDVLTHVAEERQTLMFSATFPASIIKFSQKYLNKPERISIKPESMAADKIKQETVFTTDANKYTDLVTQLDQRSGSIIVFVKTQHGADRLARRLEREEHNTDAIHGGLKQRQREKAIAAFRAKKTRIMIATDVAARGLDVPHIETVINYDLPQNPEDYIHRIGRTARADAEGTAVSLVTPSDKGKWSAINRLMNPNFRGQGAEEYQGGRSNNKGKPPRRSNHRKGGDKFQPPSFGQQEQSRRQGGEGAERSYAPKKKHFQGDRPHKEGGYRKPYEGKRDDRAPSDRSYADRPRSDRPASDRPRTDRPASDRYERRDRDAAPRPFRENADRPRKPREGDRDGNRHDRPRRDANGNDRGRPDRFSRDDNRSDREFRGGDFRDSAPRGDRSRDDRGNRKPDDRQPRDFKSRDFKPRRAEGEARSDRGPRKEGDSFKKEGFRKEGFKKGGFKKGGFKKPAGGAADGHRHFSKPRQKAAQ